MVRFLRTVDGGLINADMVYQIDEERREKGLTRVWRALLLDRRGFSDGCGHVRLADDIDGITKSLMPVVAASPGYMLLRYFTEWTEGGGRRRLSAAGGRVADRQRFRDPGRS